MNAALLALVAASGVHLGFQLTVTMVVHPALARALGRHGAHPQLPDQRQR